MTDKPLWDIDQLTMSGRATARLSNISLSISSGITAILGESGAGKTSLCNALVGFESADSGRLTAHFNSGAGKNNYDRLPLYWSPDGGLWPHVTVAAHLAAVAPVQPRHQINKLLKQFALEHTSNARPAALSTGERERLSVARAVASEAQVLVLDEPFAHVDGVLATQCWQSLLACVALHDGSLIYTTHAPERVIGTAHNVICLRAGTLLYHGSVAALYHQPPTRDAANCLGTTNWLSAEDGAAWFPQSACLGCVRPERIIVDVTPSGSMVVQAATFYGHVASVDIMRDDGLRRTFLHRPSRPLSVGERVNVTLLPSTSATSNATSNATSKVHTTPSLAISQHLLLFFCLMLGLVGCNDASTNNTTPTLTFSNEKTWNLPPVAATQPAPRSMGALDDDQVLILDTAGRVLVYDGSGTLVRQWLMPEFNVGRPEGIVQLKDRRIAVADTHYHRIVFFTEDGKVSSMIGGPDEEKAPGGFLYPVGVATDPAGNLYVSEYGGNDRVQKFSPAGKLLAVCGNFGTAPGSFQRPQGLAWHDGRLYIADAMNNRVQIFSDDGAFIGILGGEHPPEMHFPYNVVVSPDGQLTVVEYSGGCITRFSLDGKLIGRYGKSGSGAGEFATPWGMTIDGHGRVWVADTGNRRIVELTP